MMCVSVVDVYKEELKENECSCGEEWVKEVEKEEMRV
jgi:hypothetical protein